MRLSRRTALLLGLTALSVGASGVVRFRSQRRQAQAELLVDESRRELLAGNVSRAQKLADTAKALDAEDENVRGAWIEATGFSLLEERGGGAEAVGFVSAAHQAKAPAEEMAFVTLVSAVAMRNDRLAETLIAQHETQGLQLSGAYVYARGAAWDLACAEGAAASFAASSKPLQGQPLSRLRESRAWLLRGGYLQALAAIQGLPEGHLAVRVLKTAADRLAGGPPRLLQLPVAEVDGLPKSLRPLAVALGIHPDDPTRGIDAALDDVDTPLAALLMAELVLQVGDLASARQAAEAARRMRPELSAGAVLGARLLLLEGDLEAAEKFAENSQDPAAMALCAAIRAYESKDAAKLLEVIGVTPDLDVVNWAAAAVAKATLGDTQPEKTDFDALMNRSVPWAEMVGFDSAIRRGDRAHADALSKAWKRVGPAHQKRRDQLKDAGAVAPKP